VIVHGQARAFCVLMGEDEGSTRATLDHVRGAVAATFRDHGGHLREASPDTVVAEFGDASTGVAGAIAAQEGLARLNHALAAEARVHYRFGIDGKETADTSPEAAEAAVERAAVLGFQAHTDGIHVSEAVRSRLPFGSTQRFAMAGPGAYAFAREAGPADKGPAQIEALELPMPANKPSITNGPFSHIGDDPQGEAFAEGLRLDIQNCLTKMSGVFLLGAGAGNNFRGAPPIERARRTGCRYALDGSVRRSGDQVRVDVRLLDTVTDQVMWSEQYDRVIDETFRLEDEIAERIVTELDVNLVSGEQARIWRKALTNKRARQQFYEGYQAMFRMNAESMVSARMSFERVAELVPDSPHGPGLVSLCLWHQYSRGWVKDREETLRLAGEWAERAVRFEDADGQAHTILGNVRLLQGRFDEAMEIAREAVTRRPGCPNANGFYANVLLHCGDPGQAIVHVKRAIRYVPVYPPWFVEILAAAYRDAGHHDLGVMAAREAIRIAPQSITARMILTSALVRGNWLADAKRVAGEVMALDSNFSLSQYLAAPYRDAAVLDRLREDLRRAGLPE
jgi:adenylate cyclase